MATRQLSGDTTVNDVWHFSRSLECFTSNFSKNGVWYFKSYYRQLIGNHTLAFDWCHFWWPWSTFEGHFSLGCHFYIHFSYPWHAFASHDLPAIAELLVKYFSGSIVYITILHHSSSFFLAYWLGCVPGLRLVGYVLRACDYGERRYKPEVETVPQPGSTNNLAT